MSITMRLERRAEEKAGKSKKAKERKSERLGVTRLGRVALACCASSRQAVSTQGALIADAGAVGMAGSGQKRTFEWRK